MQCSKYSIRGKGLNNDETIWKTRINELPEILIEYIEGVKNAYFKSGEATNEIYIFLLQEMK